MVTKKKKPAEPPRLDAEDVKALARDVVTNIGILTNNERVIESAFYMVTTLFDWSTIDTTKIGALYGARSDAVPGRGMNGYPIFTSMRLIHIDDMPAVQAEIDRMDAALK